jgi:hypothetical protein
MKELKLGHNIAPSGSRTHADAKASSAKIRAAESEGREQSALPIILLERSILFPGTQ